MDLDLDLVASFLALVDEWHYGRAAQALYLTPSALTKRIQRLERQVGVSLVKRGTDGGLGLTDAGLQFAAAARPLLLQARSAAKKARAQPRSHALRVGVPSGAAQFLRLVDIAGIERDFRRSFPPVRVEFVEVPFPLVASCLPEKLVDVLFTIAPVCHPDVESIPLPLTSARMGVVSMRHPLADAHELDVAQLCEYQLLCNPAIPDEWMRQFWFADVRPRREARLVTTHGANQQQVMRDAWDGSVAMVTLEPMHAFLGPGMRGVRLVGAAPLTFHAARRRTDRRAALVNAYIELLRALSPDRLT